MSLGTGYEYLWNSVARGDVEAAASSPLTRYYAASGSPPGRFLGAGLAGLGNGAGIAVGTIVTERDLFRLLGMMQDPLTGDPLGGRPMRWRIGAGAQPVAGFDLTFSVPKSVSVVWALADPDTQEAIHQAHRDAIEVALGWAEEQVFFSRSGHGGTVRERVRGVVATGFDHWDSRAGDPHLHTHVVVANRAQSVSDGKWRSLDSRTLFAYVVALSELHEGVLHDLLTDRLGYGWDERTRVHSPVPRWDITGVSDALIAEFSRRSADIEDTMTTLVSEFADAHGRQPSRVEMLRLRQQATLSTRPDKQPHTLLEQTEQWRSRARTHLADTADPVMWSRNLRDRSVLPALDAGVDQAMLAEVASLALHTVGSQRATFSPANALAEVHRQLHGARFATPTGRLTIADHTTRLALEQALLLTPSRDEGTGIYTTREILNAETRLLEAARDTTAPGLPPDIVDVVLEAVGATPSADDTGASSEAGDGTGSGVQSGRLTAEQVGVVHAISSSGRVLDLLVGPAGAGKTTTLTALRKVWETGHGAATVTGLAPSAAAAQVLADELGIATDNTAKWLTEQAHQDDRRAQIAELERRIRTETSSRATAHAQHLYRQLDAVADDYERWSLRAGQLVVIDEASLAGTVTLDAITDHARHAGAKVVLVGDWAQLGAVEAGGAFAMLARDRGDVPQLNEVHRFTQAWEREASLQLRAGDPAVLDTYADHDRIREGTRDDMVDTLYQAWRQDTDHGLESVMIAADRRAVAELNQRAQADRVTAGHVSEHQVPIADGTAGVGDQIVTRRNDRTLRTPGGWVKNGDTWTVTSTEGDGSLRVRSDDATEIMLPEQYVRDHVELGYASTAHRVQGRTVDTAHALVDTTSPREVLYVAATRGRQSNTLYVDTTEPIDYDTSHGPAAESPAAAVLQRVLDSTSADTAAHDAYATELVEALERARRNQSEHAPFTREPWAPIDQSPSMYQGIGY
jgi:conjugative relaxase-like TrwC/TraI family protein